MITRMSCADSIASYHKERITLLRDLFQEIAENIGLRFMEERKPFFNVSSSRKEFAGKCAFRYYHRCHDRPKTPALALALAYARHRWDNSSNRRIFIGRGVWPFVY